MDSVLRTHRVNTSNLLYDISGVFDPPSIKDQIIRATLVIERAIKENLIGSKRPLLVIGGGFAGVTAGIKAARDGVPTFLIEQNSILHKFRGLTRFISPTQYDFPHSHWIKQSFPWKGKGKTIPVFWENSSVESVLESFNEEIEYTQETSPFYIANFVTCKSWSIEETIKDKKGNPFVKANLSSTKTSKVEFSSNYKDILIPDTFGMILTCLGIGEEIISPKHSNYRGIYFWNFDVISESFKNNKVLICGAGDGGLQDFLLLSTKEKSASMLYKLLSEVVSKTVLNKIESEILKSDDIAHRDSLFSGDNTTRSCQIQRCVHKKHLAMVKTLFDGSENEVKVKELLSSITSDLFNKNSIFLSHSCDHFPKTYSLNRFLVLLLAKYKESVSGQTFLLPKIKVKTIDGENKDHECSNNFYECLGKSHKITYVNANCSKNLDTAEKTLEYKPDLVIVRFGINKKGKETELEKFYNCLPENRGLQTLPYILP